MLDIKVTQGSPDITLSLHGELDVATGELLQQAMEKIELDGVRSITFSLDGLEFIDSTGIGQLLGYYKSFAKRNLAVYIQNQNDDIEGVLELIGVREIMGS